MVNSPILSANTKRYSVGDHSSASRSEKRSSVWSFAIGFSFRWISTQ